MAALADIAVSILSQAQRQAEIAGQNISNGTTPAYKRRVAFSTFVGSESVDSAGAPQVRAAVDFRPGKLSETGNPTDFAIQGQGYFALRREGRIVYSREGRFSIDGDGRIVNDRGFALQLATGGDMQVKSSEFNVTNDGSVYENGVHLGKIAIYAPAVETGLDPVDGGFQTGSTELALEPAASVRQGTFETSNVATGDEMIVLMEAVRRAEAGQRVMNTYDDLMGRVINSFGDAVR